MNTDNENRLPSLPATSEKRFWEDSETYQNQPAPLPEICPTHGRLNWMQHIRYQVNSDGTISCLDCSWGSSIPGYYRIVDGKVVDLRHLS